MKLGSHNTFTYLPVKQWYLKPFAFAARCQEVDIWQQYALGVRLFDLRIRFNDKGTPIICHGIIQYEHPDNFIYEVLNKLNKCKGIYIRVVLECKKSTSNEYLYQYTNFVSFCLQIKSEYPNVTFFGGNDRTGFSTGEPVYNFGNDIKLHDRYSSTTSLFKSKNRFLRIIDDLYPRYYAKTHNIENIEEFKEAKVNDRWLFIDFVNIK